MAKFVNADELMDSLTRKKSSVANQRYTEGFNDALMRFRSMLHSAPVADVVEVVRCSECQHWGGVTFGFICRKFSGVNTKICMHADDYCSYGERRSDNEPT